MAVGINTEALARAVQEMGIDLESQQWQQKLTQIAEQIAKEKTSETPAVTTTTATTPPAPGATTTPPPAEAPPAAPPAPEVPAIKPEDIGMTPEAAEAVRLAAQKEADLLQQVVQSQTPWVNADGEDVFAVVVPGESAWKIPVTDMGDSIYHPLFEEPESADAKAWIEANSQEEFSRYRKIYEGAKVAYATKYNEYVTGQAVNTANTYKSDLEVAVNAAALSMGLPADAAKTLLEQRATASLNGQIAQMAADFMARGHNEQTAKNMAIAYVGEGANGRNLAASALGFGSLSEMQSFLGEVATQIRKSGQVVAPGPGASTIGTQLQNTATNNLPALGATATADEVAGVMRVLGKPAGTRAEDLPGFNAALEIYRKSQAR